MIRLSDHFTHKKLLRFTFPTIIMMIFSSIYGVVDGFFVSNYAGKVPFAAVNLIMPFLIILGAVGFMFGAGGSALAGKTLGEGDKEKANRRFSMIVYTSIITGLVLTVLGIAFIRPVARFLGAEGVMLEHCVLYGRIILIALIAFLLQMEFQSFFITAEKPQLGLIVTVAAGVTNMVLDFLLVGVFKLGLAGAAAATAISQAVGGIIPLIYFMCPNSSILRLTKTKFDAKVLTKTCTNGMSELLGNISMSVVSMLYNMQLLKYAGEDGVASYGVLMYVGMIFCGVSFGYAVGISPVISFHFGAKNYDELKNLRKRSFNIILVFSVAMVALALLLARPLSEMFVGYDENLFAMALTAFKFYSFAFLFAGFAIFGSAFFTALNDGVTSAIISFLRTIVFQITAVMLMPIWLGINGIWLSLVAVEIAAAILSIAFIIIKKKKYNY
ncbi:MAG: MATE family efflux transporter [Clostridia bacterium]|nr:MATE family efflux transporter [Clostridia bacterium]